MTNSLPRNGSAPMTGNLPMSGFRVTGLAAAIDPTDAPTKAQVDTASPIGSVIDFAGQTAPGGWLLCSGQAVSRTTYAALFTAIGTTYGAGDNSTTFNIPDCRGRVTAGKDNMGGTNALRLTGTTFPGTGGGVLGAASGLETHTLSEAQMPAHAHLLTGTTDVQGAHAHNYLSGTFTLSQSNAGDRGGPAQNRVTDVQGAHAHNLSGVTDYRGGNAAHNNVQPTIIFNKIIRAT